MPAAQDSQESDSFRSLRIQTFEGLGLPSRSAFNMPRKLLISAGMVSVAAMSIPLGYWNLEAGWGGAGGREGYH